MKDFFLPDDERREGDDDGADATHDNADEDVVSEDSSDEEDEEDAEGDDAADGKKGSSAGPSSGAAGKRRRADGPAEEEDSGDESDGYGEGGLSWEAVVAACVEGDEPQPPEGASGRMANEARDGTVIAPVTRGRGGAAAKAARGGSNDKSNSKRYSQRGGSGSGAANDPQGSAKPRAKKAGDQKALPTRTAAGQSKVAKMKQGKRVGGKKV